MEQKDILEAGALAIENIDVLEQAKSLLDNEVHPVIFVAVDQAIKSNLDDNWESNLSDSSSNIVDESWFAKQSWKNEDGSYFSQFRVWTVGDDALDNTDWWISLLVGLADTEMGIEWSVKWKLVDSNLDRKSWKKEATTFYENNPELAKLGFKYKSKYGTFFLPIHIDKDKLVESWKNDEVNDVLDEIIGERMKVIGKSINLFDRLIEEVKSR